MASVDMSQHPRLTDLQRQMEDWAPTLDRQRGRKALLVVLVLTGSTFFAELIGGIVSHSLALIADAMHMLTDISALSLSMLAIWLVDRPATTRRTFGYYRAEIIAALFNGSLLGVVAGGIIWKAWERLQQPVYIRANMMLIIALIGLGVNLIGAFILYRHRTRNLNLRSAFFHVLADGLGSLSAVVAAVLIVWWRWFWVDAVVSLLVSGLIISSAWHIIRDAVHILMEGTPMHIDLNEVRAALLRIPGVQDVHDLHVWTVTSGVEAMSGHAVVQDLHDTHRILMEARSVLAERFNIHHVTLQLECCDFRPTEPEI